jgi:xanthine phosphoribosyltransferase
MGAVRIVESSGATLVGIGSVIEKAFQPGREKLRTLGYEPVALARIGRLDEGVIEFEEN